MKPLGVIRADVVGSLLRPGYLKETRLRFEEGELSREELRDIEDQAVRLQEEIGLGIITDGEFRRLNFEESFLASVGGFGAPSEGTKFYEERAKSARPLQREEVPPLRKAVVEKVRLVRNLPLEEFSFADRVAERPVKITLLNADHYRQRVEEGGSLAAYSSSRDFMIDVVRVERQILSSLIEAGCRYIQIDGPRYAAFVDARSTETMRRQGRDPVNELSVSIQADNDVIRGFAGVTFGLHICRGNRNSMWLREGGYEAIAERLFNELHHHRLLLEYDSPRAGSFEPLRFVPKDKVVVLGLVSTKTPDLESMDLLRRRIEEASRYVPLERLAISPQCGFATNIGGNLISEDNQKRKLELVVKTAEQVWGMV